MDYSQWQQTPAPAMQPAEMNQSAFDANNASYYAYYAPALNPNPDFTSESSAIAIPPPPGVVDAYSSSAATATASYVTVDTTPYHTLDTNAQSLAWREAVRIYGTDPLAVTGAGAIEQPHSIYPGFSCPSHIVQAQLPGFVSPKKQSKKARLFDLLTVKFVRLTVTVRVYSSNTSWGRNT
ncbi:uncharacterized protein LOC18013099 [Eutrema salsugineum]|uniref:uncharacterized protein LOC18013099 n=1 Tax=Eutrema salsugineum TaxID=72664 RepID=UPI000CED0065|nr:uncharacterized protein LOC18013099 [Eutrema salsugineum]